MSQLRNLSIIILIALVSAASVQAQVAATTKHFEKDGLTFEYPAQWNLTDDNSQDERTVTLKPEAGATQILVALYRGPVPTCDFETEGKKITNLLSKRVAIVIQAGDAPVSVPVKAKAADSELEGIELNGIIQRMPALGDIYSARMKRQFVSLVYVRRVEDERASAAWELFLNTLKVELATPGRTIGGTQSPEKSPVRGWVLNGQALSLPKPDYPPIAIATHAAGTVVVQVTIDESGAVIVAHAVSGPPLLQAGSVAAAERARFSPTQLCGEPVRVTGVITYTFVAQ